MDLDFPGNFTFSLLCAKWHAVKKMTRNSETLELDVAISLLFFLVLVGFCFDTDFGYINISLIVVYGGFLRTKFRT